MKNNIILTMATCFTWVLIPSLTTAQINLGVKGGGTYSTLTGDVGQVDQHTALTAGIFLNLKGSLFSLQPEALFTQKGATNVDNNFNVREDFKINYVEFPVLLKLGLPLPVVYPHIYLGPYYAHKLNQTYTVTQIDGNAVVQETENMNFRLSDFGAVAGAGIDIQGKRFFLSIDGRYGFGLSSIDDGGNYASRNIHNGHFTLSGGIGIRLY